MTQYVTVTSFLSVVIAIYKVEMASKNKAWSKVFLSQAIKMRKGIFLTGF